MQNHKQQPESGTPSVQPQGLGEPKFTSGEGTKAQRHEGTGAEDALDVVPKHAVLVSLIELWRIEGERARRAAESLRPERIEFSVNDGCNVTNDGMLFIRNSFGSVSLTPERAMQVAHWILGICEKRYRFDPACRIGTRVFNGGAA